MTSPVDIEVGRRIREARREAGFRSPESFSAVLGIAVATLQRWESGKTSVTLPKLQRVAQATGKPVEFFVGKAPETEQAA